MKRYLKIVHTDISLEISSSPIGIINKQEKEEDTNDVRHGICFDVVMVQLKNHQFHCEAQHLAQKMCPICEMPFLETVERSSLP